MIFLQGVKLKNALSFKGVIFFKKTIFVFRIALNLCFGSCGLVISGIVRHQITTGGIICFNRFGKWLRDKKPEGLVKKQEF